MAIAAGETITERQALEALLLPSADNMAWILARWDAGSQAAFAARMNAAARSLAMTGTSYTDPSGLDPSTTSTAADQVRLGMAAMQVPALAAITAESTAVVPVAGVVRNTNALLGRDGIVGLKTGSTQAAGGCLLVAAWQQVNGHNILIVAATFSQPGPARTILPNALRAAHNLVLALDTALNPGAQPGSRDNSEGRPLKGEAERAMARRWFTDLLGWAPFTGASASAPRASPGARLAAGRPCTGTGSRRACDGGTARMRALDAATGLVLLAAGLMSIRRAPGCLLLAAGLAWFAGDAASWAVYLHRGPLVQLVAVYPFLRPRGTWAWVLTAAGYLCAVLPVLTASSPAAFALAAALVLSAGYRFAVATGPQRRARASALGAASALACALSVGPALQLAGLGDSGFAVPYDLLIMVIAAGVAVDLRWGRWSRATVSGLVVELAQPGPLRARLARALGDPGLTVGLWVAARGGYVDESGREVTVPPAISQLGQTVTFLDVDGQPAGVLIHDTPAPADQVLVAEVASAARLAMANAGLREGVRARSVEVAASRRRLVATGDAVRRALAEDLGQGPGRHLVRAAEFLGGADGEVPGALLAGVERAQAVLRDLVTGIHPAALTAGGLSDALPGLAELCPVPVSLDAPPRRFPAGVEAAVYFVCSEALANIARHAGATTAVLRVRERDGRLYLEISDDGVGGAVIGDGIQAGGRARGSGLRGLADRMAALGGSLAVDSPPGAGTRVTAELPLAGAPALGP